MDEILQKTKAHFWSLFDANKAKYPWFNKHIPCVENIAKHILKIYRDANPDVVMLSVWLYNIGILTKGLEGDYAVASEEEARKFLTENNVDQTTIDAVAHAVRAHKLKDVMPETVEAKILAVADAASHTVEPTYADMASRGDHKQAMELLEQDYQVISLLPGVQSEMVHVYDAWRQLLQVFPK
jgi:hypothetical protein